MRRGGLTHLVACHRTGGLSRALTRPMQRRSRRRTSLHQGGEDRGDSVPAAGRSVSAACRPRVGTQAGVRLVFAGCPRTRRASGRGVRLMHRLVHRAGFRVVLGERRRPDQRGADQTRERQSLGHVHLLRCAFGQGVGAVDAKSAFSQRGRVSAHGADRADDYRARAEDQTTPVLHSAGRYAKTLHASVR